MKTSFYLVIIISDGVTEIWVILSVLNVEIHTLSDRPLKSGLMWLRELLHPMDSLERMYSPSIAMYPSKCVCIHASVPQWFKGLKYRYNAYSRDQSSTTDLNGYDWSQWKMKYQRQVKKQ